MPSKILNTNMGLGFQRGRKYDTDLDRLGRIDTSQGELRKTRELNMQTEMKKLKKSMKTYSIRRFSELPYQVMMTESELRIFSEALQREFGMMGDIAENVVGGVRDLTGNVVEGAGKVVGSGVGKVAGGLLGVKTGAGIGAALGGSIAPVFGHIGGGILGGLAGGLIGSKGAEVAGNTLKDVGQTIHT